MPETLSSHTPIAERRTYRRLARVDRLVSFQVTVQETDLKIQAESDLAVLCREEVLKQRGYIENYIHRHPQFRTTLNPWEQTGPAPGIIRKMIAAGWAAGVGPMAAVAGAVAETVGRALGEHSREFIVENGGDIYLAMKGKATIGLYAGRSPLSMRVALQLEPGQQPLAVCTSSGTVGHSLSRGRADAVWIVARDGALADAAATAAANHVFGQDAIPQTIAWARAIPGVEGVVAVCGNQMGLWGAIRIVRLDGEKRLEI
ncbi:MAG: UPF0280 family protein [Desulfobacterales bacterium]|jgi:hypothetical protein